MSNRVSPGQGFIRKYMSGTIKGIVVGLLVLLQFAIVFFLAYKLSQYGLYVYYAIELVGVFTITNLINNRSNASFKIGWLFVIAAVPIGGLIMYLLWGRSRTRSRITKRHMTYIDYGSRFVWGRKGLRESFDSDYPDYSKLSRFMEQSNFELLSNSRFTYYSSGEDAFEAVIDDLENAKKFIFLSFFIVADGALWNRIRPILLDKASKGIEIRFLYDDFGAMFRTDKAFWNELREGGIQVARFNRITKYLEKLYMNYRNHQKIIVIDGNIGYTGGFNLADEYVNAIDRFGHWKDGGVRIDGEGTFGLTKVFLEMWDMTCETRDEDFFKYGPDVGQAGTDADSMRPGSGSSYCHIIADGPENNPENPILSTIRQLIYESNDFLYITTPYLVLEDDMGDALIQAARSGVDVRILTPAIPDKKMVYLLTRYNYGRLLAGGVRIFEYTPGFVHAKNIVTKDCAIIGTINLDFRSLYLHYECGAVLWDRELNRCVKEDISAAFDMSREVTYEDWLNRPAKDKIRQWFLNIFSSLT